MKIPVGTRRQLWMGAVVVGVLLAACTGEVAPDAEVSPLAGQDPTATRAPATPTLVPETPTQTPVAPTAEPSPTSEPAVPDEEKVSSTIENFALEDLTVTVGTTVTWSNADRAPHTATAGAPSSPSGEWNSGRLDTGSSFSFTFDEEGSFPYFCAIHPSMTGTVTVLP